MSKYHYKNKILKKIRYHLLNPLNHHLNRSHNPNQLTLKIEKRSESVRWQIGKQKDQP